MKVKVAYLAFAGALLASGSALAAQTDNMTVTATITATCDITATTLDFGSIATTVADSDQATTASVLCNSAIPFTVGADGGQNNNLVTRRMSDGGTNFLEYELYTDGTRTTVLDDVGQANVIADTSDGTNPNTINIFGRIPAQTTPPAATYNDTVVLTVSY